MHDDVIKEYCGKKGGEYFRNGVVKTFDKLNELEGLKDMTKVLAINLAETLYINDAEAFKAEKLLYSLRDYGHEIHLCGEVTKTKEAKKSLGRLLVFVRRKIRMLEKQLKNANCQTVDLQRSISNLMRGKVGVEDCGVCEGTGKVYDEDGKRVTCWNCFGDKKVIGEK